MHHVTLELDDMDYEALQSAIAHRQRWRSLPDGGGNLTGRVVAEIARGWMDMLQLEWRLAEEVGIEAAEANARLIVLTPELLAVCEEVSSVLRTSIPTSRTKGFYKAVANLRRVLTKAGSPEATRVEGWRSPPPNPSNH